jgi:hypothetical protein
VGFFCAVALGRGSAARKPPTMKFTSIGATAGSLRRFSPRDSRSMRLSLR